MRRPTLLLALVLVALLAAMFAKQFLIQAPPVRAQPAAGEFGAQRAKARLAFVLGDERPHPADTPANDRVRGRIVRLLADMGLSPVVRDQVACNELYKSRGVSCARVRNVIAILGASTGKALLLNAHYDSTAVGPGAGDAGIGVATLLEVASILRNCRPPFVSSEVETRQQRPSTSLGANGKCPLRRPVVLLFNEGEELGLVGARAFLSDPLSRNIDSLINLEARGVRGPVNMFETSRPNAAAIGVFSRAVANPVANSLSTDVYRLMPNYTDVNTFSERGWLTLNLAPIGNETRYHSPGDNVAALDLATLQHMGDQTLALTRELANGTPGGSGERIFMDLGGRVLITLPLAAGAVMLLILLAAFAWLSWRRGKVARAAVIVVGTLVLSGTLSWAALTLIGAVRHGMFWRAHPVWTHLATYASVMFVAAVLLATVGRRAEIRQLRAAFWLGYLLIGAVIGIIAPGGIIFFLFPPLLALIGIVTSRWWPLAEPLGSAAAIIALYLTWGAMLGLLEELLNSGPMWVFAPLGALLLLPMLIEAKPLIDAVRLRGAALVAGVLALLGWAAAAAAPAYSADRQQRWVIEHVTDAGTGKAYWSVLNGGAALPRAYEERADWRWDKLPYADQERWLADAPPAPDTAVPAVEPVSVLANGNERTVTVRLRTNGADRVIFLGPEDAQIRAAGAAGFVRPIDAATDEGKYLISCSGRSCDGLELVIVKGRPQPVEFTLVGSRFALPPGARPLIAARPRNARPQYAPDQTMAFTRVKL